MKLEKLKLTTKVLSKENLSMTSGGRMSSVKGTNCSTTNPSDSSDCCSDIGEDSPPAH